MKCVKCGSEIAQGRLYCSKCGHEVQIVTDDEVLEDEYLGALLREKKQKTTQQEKRPVETKPKRSRSKSLQMVIGCLFVAALLVGLFVKGYVDQQNANSYDYQVGMAQKQMSENNPEEALKYYNTALSLLPEDVDVRMAMADIYMAQEDYDAAMVLYLEVVRLDHYQKEAYENLILLYEQNEDYDSILQLSTYAPTEEIAALFEPYHTDTPIISPISDTYHAFINVNLDSLAGDTIYYTMDGSVPDEENGFLYDADKGIPLNTEGKFIICAVCVSAKGIYSNVVENEYEIELISPKGPVVTPDGGTMEENATISIWAQNGCAIYYTWDQSIPDTTSARYIAPIEVPEGENILTVIVIDENTGLKSNVYRGTFRCMPETETEIKTEEET